MRDQPDLNPAPISPLPLSAYLTPLTDSTYALHATPNSNLLGLLPGQPPSQAIEALSSFSALASLEPFATDAERSAALSSKLNGSCGMALLGQDSRAVAHIECAALVLVNLPGLDLAYGRILSPDEKIPSPSWTPAWILLRFTSRPDHDHFLESAVFCSATSRPASSTTPPRADHALLSLMRNAGAWGSHASYRHEVLELPQLPAQLCPHTPEPHPDDLSWTHWRERFGPSAIEHAHAIAPPTSLHPTHLIFWASWIHQIHPATAH